jgi:hypothetical protein
LEYAFTPQPLFVLCAAPIGDPKLPPLQVDPVFDMVLHAMLDFGAPLDRMP